MNTKERKRRRRFLITSERSWSWSGTGDGGGRVISTGGVSGSVAAVTETWETEEERHTE